MNKENSDYKIKVLRTAIVVCWVLLISCFLLKLFGSKVFELAVVDPTFMSVCNWLDTSGFWCKLLIGFSFSVGSSLLIIIASSWKTKVSLRWCLTIFAITSCLWVIKFYFPIPGLIAELIMFITIPPLITKKWYSGIYCYEINLVFQLISMYIKGQDVQIFSNNSLFLMIFAIDYYIMIALFFLYALVIRNKINNKEE